MGGVRTYQTADKVEDTSQQETDGCQDLEERLGQETPERVELLLGVGHILDLPLRTVDAGGDGTRELVCC